MTSPEPEPEPEPGKWQARRQGGELPVDEALEAIGCYIKFK